MFAKLAVLIVAFGVVGGGLLATRQLRIQAAHELADVQKRVNDHDRELWELRIEIAQRSLPQQVASRLERIAAERRGATGADAEAPVIALEPIGAFRYTEYVQREAERSLMLASDEQHVSKPAGAKSKAKKNPAKKSKSIAAR